MKKLTALLALALGTFGFAFAGEYQDISVKELDEAIKAGKVTILDVNGTGSYANRGHIPGAIDFAASQEKLATLLPEDKGQLVVAYCGGPACSAYKRGADAASALGYTNVKHLSAGISGWIESGMQLAKAEGSSDGKPACSSCEKKTDCKKDS